MNKKVLFISYNGMTDPLGQAQVLPYLTNLAQLGFEISILSCEKPERLKKEGEMIRSITTNVGIKWNHVLFHNRVPFLSKLFDRQQLKKAAIDLYRKEKFDIVHCRSYIPAEIGWALKKKFGVKFIFDMRGFWADEKKDSKHWNIKNPVYSFIYNHYKSLEKKLLLNADAIVVLTHEAKKEIQTWSIGAIVAPKINVIPCCADLAHFSLSSVDEVLKKEVKEKLKLTKAHPVLCYLGSIGDSYAVDEMLYFFKLLLKKNASAKFLFFTRDNPQILYSKIVQNKIDRNSVKVLFVKREQLPTYLSLCDFSVFFYVPTYSRKACSPTKFAEISGLGIPMICNSVGDLKKELLEGLPHIIINDLGLDSLNYAAEQVASFEYAKNEESIRNFVIKEYNLDNGVLKYQFIYNNLSA